MLQIAFGQSKYYVDSLSENTKRGLRQKVRNGIFPAPAPMGYLNDVRTKTIVINPQKGPILKAAFQLYAKGHSRLEDIAHFLASKGLVSRKNNQFHKDRITFFLSNPFYIGLFRYGGEIHEGKHEPLIAKKLFTKVQEVLKARGKTVVKTATPKAFTGLLRCGICSMMITAEIQEKFYKGTNRHVVYTYYHCTRKSKTIVCRDIPIREEELDQQLSRLLLAVSLPSDWAENMKKQMKKDAMESAQSVAPIVAGKQQELSKLSMKLQHLLDSYLDQDIDKETYRKKKQELMVKKQTLEESIVTLQQSQNVWLEPLKTWISDASTVASVARGKDLTQKKEYLKKAFGLNLRLTHQKARGSALEPWAALRAAPTSRNWVDDGGFEPPTPST
ncbi:recombinase family protein [Candidatus Gottesmanbacteria bacterium]|nr:recombinase family protein [Candidatus Gottesmanbacteria bacterium]